MEDVLSLLAGTVLLPPRPAEAQTTHWSATLTVDRDSAIYYGCDNITPSQDNYSNSTVLSNDSFTIGGVTYRVTQLYQRTSGNIFLAFTTSPGLPRAIRSKATLILGTNSFPLGSADDYRLRRSKWNNPGFTWTDGQQVSVSLTLADPITGFTAKNLPVTIVKETVRRNGWPYPIREIETETSPSSCHPSARIANRYPSDKIVGPAPSSSTHTRYHCLEWNDFSGATAFYLRRQYAGVTASTTCSTALTDDGWAPYTVSKMRLTASLAAVQHDGQTGYSTGFACYQVQARNSSGTVVATSPAILVKFGGTSQYPGHGYGKITAIDGTTVTAQGGSDPLASRPAEVALSTSPTTVPEGTAVTVTATLSRSLSAAVTIPLTVTRVTSEDGDHGILSAITITGGSLSGSGTITTTSDADGDDETFTVAVNTSNLPAGVTAGSPVSKTVTITLDTAAVATDSFTVSYAKPAPAPDRLRDAANNEVAVFTDQTVVNKTAATATPVAGNAPTGQPTVSGTERVGHVLTAATRGIADQDGLSSPGWTYQWVRVEEGSTSTSTNITSATSATYTLAAADAGKKVRVKVAFTDDGNTAHTLESTNSGVIAAAHATAPDPVAAVNVTHQGSSLEVSWNAPARATLEIGLRHDGGDAETGFGLDLGGGITLSRPARGRQAEVRGRGLLTHAAEGFRDQGFSGSLSWQQRPDSDLGPMVSLTQTMGGSSSGGADALLSRVNLEGLAANDDEGTGLTHQRTDLRIRYGFLTLGERFTLTPELGLGLYNSGRDYRIGWSLARLVKDGESFTLSFDVTRRESINNDGAVPEHGVELNLDTRF